MLEFKKFFYEQSFAGSAGNTVGTHNDGPGSSTGYWSPTMTDDQWGLPQDKTGASRSTDAAGYPIYAINMGIPMTMKWGSVTKKNFHTNRVEMELRDEKGTITPLSFTKEEIKNVKNLLGSEPEIGDKLQVKFQTPVDNGEPAKVHIINKIPAPRKYV